MTVAVIEAPESDSLSETTSQSESILSRVAAGDSDAVNECLQCYGGLVWSLAKRWSSSEGDAEDAVQEIFVELWRVAKKYRAELGSEMTFIATIARRRLIDRRRRQGSQPEWVDVDLVAERLADESAGDPVELFDESQKAAACLEKLPERKRELIRLAVQLGETHRQIAQQLKLPVGTVKSSIRRGLLQLRECMKIRQDGLWGGSQA
ncbi:MAG: sigma-70 family RNA polymerase sigma factor [Planctomycetota bacterium]